jgi:putative drug exporter of the RND superfamily
MDTFIVRTVLVPCTVILLGRWNWWPSELSRRDRQIPGAEGTETETEPVRAT